MIESPELAGTLWRPLPDWDGVRRQNAFLVQSSKGVAPACVEMNKQGTAFPPDTWKREPRGCEVALQDS